MPYSSESYLDIFNKVYSNNTEERIESLRNENIFSYKVKTIKSGNMLEHEIYPLWRGKGEISRAKKAKESKKAQKNLNDKNTKKNIIRKINANFTDEDLIAHLTYKGLAPNEEQARKDIKNFIASLRRYRRKHGLPELKYIYVIEFDDEEGSKKRIHHHILINDMDREIVESLWKKGYVNTKRLQPNEFGLEGLARYITKDPKGKKRWCASKNLKGPDISVNSYREFSRRQVEKIAKGKVDPETKFEKFSKGYKFNDLKVTYSDFVSGAYLYVRMHLDSTYKKVKSMKKE